MQAPAFHRREPRGLAMRQALRRQSVATAPRTRPVEHVEDHETVSDCLAANFQVGGLVLGAIIGFLATGLITGLFAEGLLPFTFAPVGPAATISAILGGTLAGVSAGGLIGGLLGLALENPPPLEEDEAARLPVIGDLPLAPLAPSDRPEAIDLTADLRGR